LKGTEIGSELGAVPNPFWLSGRAAPWGLWRPDLAWESGGTTERRRCGARGDISRTMSVLKFCIGHKDAAQTCEEDPSQRAAGAVCDTTSSDRAKRPRPRPPLLRTLPRPVVAQP